MHETILMKVIHHSGDAQKENQIHIRFKKSDFATAANLKKYLKNVFVNNYLPTTTARKIEVSVAGNGGGIENAIKYKAKKVEIVEHIVVDIYW